jgi:putative toxin-antitoxin system antitoxin component (TIGR02293 family)
MAKSSDPNKGVFNEQDIFQLIEMVRNGIEYNRFVSLAGQIPFSMEDWSQFLHLSERTFQRYKKEKKKFDALHSEKILEITLLFKKGTEVFGDAEKFHTWLNMSNVALGGITPKNLLDNTFGINMLKDELIRIEHGILS